MADSDAAAQAAMAEAMTAALRKFNTQLWTFYSFGVLVTILRTYSRIKSVGFKDLRPDDFIVWVAIVRIVESSKTHSSNTSENSCSTRYSQLWHTMRSTMARDWQTTG